MKMNLFFKNVEVEFQSRNKHFLFQDLVFYTVFPLEKLMITITVLMNDFFPKALKSPDGRYILFNS